MKPAADAHALTGAFVAGALSPAEHADYDRHLRDCPSCVLEVAEFTATAALFAEALAEPPPPGLRARVLTAAARTTQFPPATPLPAPEIRRSRRVLIAAAAAVLAVLLLGVQSTAPGDQVAGQVAAQEFSAEAAALLAAQDARVLSATAPGGGTLSVVHSPARAAVVLLASGLPAPAAGRGYQAWVIGVAGARSAGLLGAGKTLVAHGVAPGERIGLTVEPAGGSAQPTTLPLLTAVLPVG
ncbi:MULTISPECIES: anti-sigma factor [unclassified Crossiella]|uniref:anti-sigma factor n=1 Tax=unclassified Crossiella TaxID=2620835 RepID=UPI001FFF5A5B|nr:MULTISPECIES: anti-sigma factor [unclassified Crossiella]MCK2244508.1 anti-sigma factor [Crossiella sp. S99.2]MCK2258139.1 anti-sigma factor [Crossiella sp. S99.1]